MHVTDSSDPNWWKGRNSRGEGLFPANFVSAAAVEAAEEEVERPTRAASPAAAPVRVPSPEPAHIDERAMDAALSALHEADPSRAGTGEAALSAQEARALRMGALVDAALERADTRHARLTQLSAELVDALNLYHELMRAYPPPPAPAPYLHH